MASERTQEVLDERAEGAGCAEGAGRSPKWTSTVCGAIAVGVLCALVFSRTVSYPALMWDDAVNISENPLLHPVSWEHLGATWREPYAGLYIPVTYTFLAAEALVANDGAARGRDALDLRVFRVGQIALYGVSVGLVFLILRWGLKDPVAAICGSLFFGLHPLHVESVAWLTEVKGVLSGALALGAMATFLYGCAGDARGEHRITARWWMALVSSTMLFVLALLAKPIVVGMPLVIVAVGLGFDMRSWKTYVVPMLGWCVAAAVVAGLTFSMQGSEPAVSTAIWQRPIVAVDAVSHYLTKLAIPWNLAPDYGRTPARVLGGDFVWFVWVVPVLLVVVASLHADRRIWWTAIGVFVIGLLPVLGLVPFDYQRYSTVADRYAFLAVFGGAVAVAWLVERFPTKIRGYGLVATFCVLAVLAALSWRQAGHWRDDASLCRYALRVNPVSAPMLTNQGVLLLEVGATAEARSRFARAIEIDPLHAPAHNNLGWLDFLGGRRSDAMASIRRAIEIEPENAGAHNNLGSVLASTRRYREAEPAFQEAIRLAPDSVKGHLNLASVLAATQRTTEAVAQLELALERQPFHELVHLRMGELKLKQNEPDAAIDSYREAIATRPDFAEAYQGAGIAFFRLGRLKESESCFQEAIRFDPEFVDAHYELGNLYSGTRDYGHAAAAYEATIQLDGTHTDAHHNLGSVYYVLGRYQEAVASYRRAIELRPGFEEAERNLGVAEAKLKAEQSNEDAP